MGAAYFVRSTQRVMKSRRSTPAVFHRSTLLRPSFRLDILLYCNKEELIKCEQHYINLLNPEYNTLKVAKSSLCEAGLRPLNMDLIQ